MPGYLEVTFGPMFSGKTTSLIDKANRFISIRQSQKKTANILIINFIGDNRATLNVNGLTPHTERTIQSENSINMRVKNLKTVDISNFDYIVVDESQFFDDLEESVMDWLKLDKHIHCSGLVADSNRNTFGQLCRLIPRADTVEQLKAFCYVCGDKILNAPFTKRIVDGSEVIKIGGKESYLPVCGNHFNT
jgi:thymidine kinase